jgi:uncharacterized protein
MLLVAMPLLGLLLAGCGVGLLSALLGIGGGLVMVPLLTIMGLPIASATATSLVAVFLSSLSATLRNLQQQDIDGRVAIGLSLSGMITAQLGAAAAARLPDRPVSIGFALLLGLTIYLMSLKRQLSQAEAPKLAPASWPVIAIGLVAGLLSGLFGVGGGVIMVPLQLLALGSPIKVAVRTSLGAIVLISLSGLVQSPGAVVAGNLFGDWGYFWGSGWGEVVAWVGRPVGRSTVPMALCWVGDLYGVAGSIIWTFKIFEQGLRLHICPHPQPFSLGEKGA